MSGAEEDDLKMLSTTLESHRGMINRREERTRACYEGDPAHYCSPTMTKLPNNHFTY